MNYLYQILLLNKSQLIAALLVLKVDGENSNFKKPNSDMFKLNLKIWSQTIYLTSSNNVFKSKQENSIDT